MRSIKILLAVIAFLLVVDGIGVYYLISQSINQNQINVNQCVTQIFSPDENSNLNENIEEQPGNENLNTNSNSQSGVTICATLDCLSILAGTCQKGELVYNLSAPFPFEPLTTYTSKTYFKINGMDAENNCTFIQQLQSATITVTPENKQKMIANGQTAAEIDNQLKMINDSYKEVANQIMDCKGSGQNVATYLKNLEINKGGSSSCNLGVGEATCTLEPDISCIMTRKQNHDNPDCSLSTLTAELGLFPGLSLSISATGFKDGSRLSWVVSDSNIANASAENGESIMIRGLKVGSTQLKVTDNAVGSDCFVIIPVTVK